MKQVLVEREHIYETGISTDSVIQEYTEHICNISTNSEIMKRVLVWQV